MARSRWIGWIVTAIPVLFLIFDASIKLAHIQPVTDAFARLGIPDHLAVTIGTLELICLAVYLLPRTAVIGAVLLTGFLGGAIMIHVRIADPLFSHILFPAYIGALLWIGLYMRDLRLRALLS
jgi:DoxX-like family